MRRKKICIVEDDDERILNSIPLIKGVKILLVSSNKDKTSIFKSTNCEVIQIPNNNLVEKLKWVYKNYNEKNIDSLIVGVNSDKKLILKCLLKFGSNLIKNRIYGYAPISIPSISRTIYILDPLVQVNPSSKELEDIALDFIGELNEHYSSDVNGVFISHTVEDEPKNSKQWKVLKELKKKNISNYFFGTTQFDRAILNDLVDENGIQFGQINTIVFPDLISANATFKALSFIQSSLTSNGAIIGGVHGLRHGILSRNCRVEQIVSMAKELSI